MPNASDTTTPFSEILNSPHALVVILDSQKQVLHSSLGILRASPNPLWKPGFQSIQDLIPFQTLLEGFGQITFLPVQKLVDGETVWILTGCKALDPQDLQKNKFLSYVVHELRTPISALFSWSELLTKKMLEKPAEIAEAHQILFQESIRLTEYLTKLLHFFRLETGRTSLELKPENLPDIVTKCINNLRELCDKHQISLFVDMETESSSRVLADAALLQIALENLLENAVLYSGNSRDIEIKQTIGKGMACLEIQDQGIGFPMELISALLQAYHTSIPQLSKRSGIGLGLPTAERIIQLHGGRMEINSQPHAGTTVKVFLPLASL